MNELINVSLDFIGNDAYNAANGIIAATSDAMFAIIAIICALAAAAGIAFWLNNKNAINGNHISKAGIKELVLNNKIACICASALVGIALIWTVAYTCAFADQANPRIVADKDAITATVDENNTYTIDTFAITNTHADEYAVGEVRVAAAENMKDALANSHVTITGFDAILYDGAPTGEAYVPASSIPVIGAASTLVNVDVQGLNAENLKSLVQNKALWISIIFVPVTTHVVTYDLNGGHIDYGSFIPAGWKWTGKSGFQKEYLTGVMLSDVTAEWANVAVVKHGAKFLGWSEVTGQLEGDLTVTAIYEGEGDHETLEDFTFEEIKAAADDLSLNGTASTYYAQFAAFAEEGQTKSIPIFMDGYSQILRVRVVGICHDTKLDGTAAGLTFMPVNSLEAGYNYGSIAKSDTDIDYYSWATSGVRQYLNSEVLWGIPYDVRSLIAPVWKNSCIGYSDPDNPTKYNAWATPTLDWLFLPSYSEMGGFHYDVDTAPAPKLAGLEGTPNAMWGIEGYRYEFLDNDPWSLLTRWHTWNWTWGPVMNNLNSYGYYWLTQGPGFWHLFDSFNDAKDAIAAVGGFVSQNIDNNEYIMERSVYPESYGKILTYDMQGNPERIDANTYTNACIAPCFCM